LIANVTHAIGIRFPLWGVAIFLGLAATDGVEWLILFLTGYSGISRPASSFGRCVLATIKAALLGNFPDGLVIVFWSLGKLHPVIVDLDGSRIGAVTESLFCLSGV
jgi:hypothetical protein